MMTHKSPSIAVIGAGAIGLSLATAMAAAGEAVALCDSRGPLGPVSVTEKGETQSWDLIHCTKPDEIANTPYAILAVKSHQTKSVAPWLRALDRADATILVAQNGVEHVATVSPYAPGANIVPSCVYLNVERKARGEIVLRKVGDRDLVLPDNDAARAMADVLRAGDMRVEMVDDFTTVAWEKLLTNVTANPLTTLTGRRLDVIRDAGVADGARALLAEAVAVGRAEGAKLTEDHVDSTVKWLQALPDGSTTSMLQDRLNGRPMEHNALTGAIIRAGQKHAIPTPMNALILSLLAAMEG